MKFTMIRTNKAKQLCVTTITTDRFLNRIAKDDAKAKVTLFRREAPFLNGQYDEYADYLNMHRVYPAAEFTKDANGNLMFKACNGLLLIKIGELRSVNALLSPNKYQTLFFLFRPLNWRLPTSASELACPAAKDRCLSIFSHPYPILLLVMD